MANLETRRSVRLARNSADHFTVTNVRGGKLDIGRGRDTDFTPVELLLAAIGGCSAIDVDIITRRRSEPDSYTIDVEADKIRDENGNHLDDLTMTFRVSFPAGEAGDAAREVLPGAVAASHDRLCTVSRTVELASPITVNVESVDPA